MTQAPQLYSTFIWRAGNTSISESTESLQFFSTSVMGVAPEDIAEPMPSTVHNKKPTIKSECQS